MSAGHSQGKVADLRGLKALVARYFPRSSVSYQVMMAEGDEIPMEEYAGKVGVWARMVDAEIRLMGKA